MPRLPAEIEMAAYYIAIEAITNVDKHAAADGCHVRLALCQDEMVARGQVLELDIRDNGQGRPAKADGGLGWVSMRAHAAEVGGTCGIKDDPRGGTVVVVRIPCPVTLD
jgi:signal transduction histidine kinase